MFPADPGSGDRLLLSGGRKPDRGRYDTDQGLPSEALEDFSLRAGKTGLGELSREASPGDPEAEPGAPAVGRAGGRG